MKMNPTQAFDYTFQAPGDSVIEITNILPFKASMEIREMAVNGDKQRALLLYKNWGNWLYQCADCAPSDTVTWSITITTNQQDAIDINEIPSQSTEPKQADKLPLEK